MIASDILNELLDIGDTEWNATTMKDQQSDWMDVRIVPSSDSQ